jgi:hypothetical protein
MVKVCYVAGSGRSGTSLLGNILGQIDGFCNGGEFFYLWNSLETPGWKCGCGALLAECPFWLEVLNDLPAECRATTAADFQAWWKASFRSRHVPYLWWTSEIRHRTAAAQFHELLEVYRSVARVSDASVVVDGSKWAAQAMIANQIPDVELYVVHVSRDPRAVAYSWARERPSAGGIDDDPMPRFGIPHSSLHWLASAGSFAGFVRSAVGRDRYLEVRYEDFARDPRRTMESILELLGESSAVLPFVDDATVDLLPSHSACGNPSRFRTGQVHISLDEEWREGMSSHDKWTAVAIAAPMMRSLGYPLSSREHGRSISTYRST